MLGLLEPGPVAGARGTQGTTFLGPSKLALTSILELSVYLSSSAQFKILSLINYLRWLSKESLLIPV